MNCKNCNLVLNEDTKICPECGMEVKVDGTKTNHDIRLSWVAITVTAGIILSLAILLVFIIINGNTDSIEIPKNALATNANITNTPTNLNDKGATPASPLQNLFYLKNGNLFYTSVDNIAPQMIDMQSQIKDTYRPFSFYDLFNIQLSDDGTQLFYPSNISTTHPEYSADIYNYNITSQSNNQLVIDLGVNNYVPNQDGSKIYYLKNRALYLNSLSNTEKIESDVEEFYISKDGNQVLYHTSNGYWYFIHEDRAKTEIDLNELQYISDDLETIYYIYNNDLYLIKNDNSPQLIASGVHSLLNVYEDGSLYYLKQNHMFDFVTEDITDTRDELRHQLKSLPVESYSLYYYSKGLSTQISNFTTKQWTYKDPTLNTNESYNLKSFYHGSYKPSLVYSQLSPTKINLSKVKDVNQLTNYIMNEMLQKTTQYVSIESTAFKLTTDTVGQVTYDTKNDLIYYSIEHTEEGKNSDLYYITANTSKTPKSKLYAKDILVDNTFFNNIVIGDSIIYFKDYDKKSLEKDLYINNKKVDRVSSSVWRIKNTSSFTYTSHENSENGAASLHLYHNGVSIKIADDVIHYYRIDENKIAYIVTSNKLYLYNNTTKTYALIDSKVSDIIPPLEKQYHGYNRPTYYE